MRPGGLPTWRRLLADPGDLNIAETAQTKKLQGEIDRFIHLVLNDMEIWLITDQTSLGDFSSESDAEVIGSAQTLYGRLLTAADFKMPLWQLVDELTSDSKAFNFKYRVQ